MNPLWLFPLAIAAEPEAEDTDFRGHLDQARFFLKKGWYDDAEGQLVAAVNTPDGRIDPEAWLMLAQVRFELTDLLGALEAASRAHSYSRDDGQLQQAAGYSQMLEQQFGIVTINGTYANLSANLRISLQAPLFDPNLKQYVNRLQARLEQRATPLPTRIGLPAGTYVINGEQLSVTAGEESRLVLSPEALDPGNRPPRLATVSVSAGVAHLFGERISHLDPAFDVQLSASIPLGPLDLGVLADWAPRSYETTRDATDVSLAGWGLGAQLGLPIETPLGIGFRPSLGYRLFTLPGLPLDCSGDAELSCAQDLDAPQWLVYGVGIGHAPFLELAVRYVDPERSAGLGVGMRLVVEHAFGTLPAAGEANVIGTGGVLSYEVTPDARGWSGTGGRLLIDAIYAF